jgi:hypothetical protein
MRRFPPSYNQMLLSHYNGFKQNLWQNSGQVPGVFWHQDVIWTKDKASHLVFVRVSLSLWGQRSLAGPMFLQRFDVSAL